MCRPKVSLRRIASNWVGAGGDLPLPRGGGSRGPSPKNKDLFTLILEQISGLYLSGFYRSEHIPGLNC